MKILQINVVYKVGSTGNIVSAIHSELRKLGHESFVVYGRGASFTEPNVYKSSPDWEGKVQALFGRLSGDFHGGAFYSTYRLLRKIKSIAPDIVHLHLMNGNFVNNYKLLTFLAENNFKTVITLHAEINYTGICEHAFDCQRYQTGCGNCPQVYKNYKSIFFDKTALEWQRKFNAYQKFKFLSIVSVSKWLECRARLSPMFINREFFVVGNGLDTDIYKPKDPTALKHRLGIKDEKIILYVTPSFKSLVKGGQHVVEIARRLLNENVVILIIGYDGEKEKLPGNVLTVGHINSQEELSQYYSLAHITLLTSKRESFSMVCAESLSCGTPVVGFQAGAPEEISVPEYSEFVTNGYIDDLEMVTRKWLAKKIDCLDVIQIVNQKYSINRMVDGYEKIYQKLIRGVK